MAIFGNAVKRIQYTLDHLGFGIFEHGELADKTIPERTQYWHQLEKVEPLPAYEPGLLRNTTYFGVPAFLTASCLFNAARLYDTEPNFAIFSAGVGATMGFFSALNYGKSAQNINRYYQDLNESLSPHTFSESFVKRRSELLTKPQWQWSNLDIADAVSMVRVVMAKDNSLIATRKNQPAEEPFVSTSKPKLSI